MIGTIEDPSWNPIQQIAGFFLYLQWSSTVLDLAQNVILVARSLPQSPSYFIKVSLTPKWWVVHRDYSKNFDSLSRRVIFQ